MKAARSMVISVGLAISFGCSGVQSDSQESPKTSNEMRYTVLTNLTAALASTGKAIRLDFQGTCYADGEDILFPQVTVHSPANDIKGLDAVRQIFSGDSDILVSEDSFGLLRVTIGQVSNELLNTKIQSLTLDETAQYNPNGPGGAIYVIEHVSDVKAAMTKLKLGKIPAPMNVFMEPAQQTLPHLSNSLSNVTVGQFLDSVARTFHGIVVYGECKESNGEGFIDIEFNGIADKE